MSLAVFLRVDIKLTSLQLNTMFRVSALTLVIKQQSGIFNINVEFHDQEPKTQQSW